VQHNCKLLQTILHNSLIDVTSSLLVKISDQTAAALQHKDHDLQQIVPKTQQTVGSVSRTGTLYTTSKLVPIPSLIEKRRLAQMTQRADTTGLLLHHRYELNLGAITLQTRKGTGLARSWSRDEHIKFSAEGYAVTITLHCASMIRQRLTLIMVARYHVSCMWETNFRVGMKLSLVVPPSDVGFKAVEKGDVDMVKQMIASKSLTTAEVTPGGYTLLHVRIYERSLHIQSDYI
jgi:hypothetical protein